jgi:hypothetical protein
MAPVVVAVLVATTTGAQTRYPNHQGRLEQKSRNFMVVDNHTYYTLGEKLNPLFPVCGVAMTFMVPAHVVEPNCNVMVKKTITLYTVRVLPPQNVKQVFAHVVVVLFSF